MPPKIVGEDELRRKLARLSNMNFLRPVVQASVSHVSGKLAVYPPSGSGNIPNAQGRWYERGWGQRWRRQDGSIGGRQSSEDLGPSWKGKATSNTRGVIGNDASYGPYVQGEEQSSVMDEIGWRTTDEVVDEEAETVLQWVQQEVDRELMK